VGVAPYVISVHDRGEYLARMLVNLTNLLKAALCMRHSRRAANTSTNSKTLKEVRTGIVGVGKCTHSIIPIRIQETPSIFTTTFHTERQ
jgi:hypothetical protein